MDQRANVGFSQDVQWFSLPSENDGYPQMAISCGENDDTDLFLKQKILFTNLKIARKYAQIMPLGDDSPLFKAWVIKCPHFSHHPTIRYMVYNGYYKVMSNIPKLGHLPTPI